MAQQTNTTPFASPSPLLAHHYNHSPSSILSGAADPSRFVLTFTDLSYTLNIPNRFSFPWNRLPATETTAPNVSGKTSDLRTIPPSLSYHSMAQQTNTTPYVLSNAYRRETYIYIRETSYNAYRRSSYVLSNAVITFLPLVILTITLVSIMYFAVVLAGGAHGFAFFFFAILATFWAGSGFVTFISGVMSHVVLAYTIAAAVFSYFLQQYKVTPTLQINEFN